MAEVPTFPLSRLLERSRQELIEMVKAGLPPEAFDALQEALDLSARELQEIVHLPQRTLFRRRAEGRLQSDETERILRFGLLYERVEQVFEDRERALRWIKHPHRALGGQTPLQYAGTEIGAQEVHELLGRIEHGIPA